MCFFAVCSVSFGLVWFCSVLFDLFVQLFSCFIDLGTFPNSSRPLKLQCGSPARLWDPRISQKTLKKPFLLPFPMPPKNPQKTLKKASAAPGNFEKPSKNPQKTLPRPRKTLKKPPPETFLKVLARKCNRRGARAQARAPPFGCF